MKINKRNPRNSWGGGGFLGIVALIATIFGIGILPAFSYPESVGTFALPTPVASCVSGKPQVTLSWGSVAPESATSFAVKRNVSGDTGDWPKVSGTITETEYTDASFPAGQGIYRYQVVGYAPNMEPGYSRMMNVTVPDCKTAAPSPTPVIAPASTPVSYVGTFTLPTPVASCVSGAATVQLAWTSTAPKSATSYMIYRNAFNSSEWFKISGAVAGTSYLDALFPAGPGVYTYQVMAEAQGREPGYSSIQNVVVPNCSTVITPPPLPPPSPTLATVAPPVPAPKPTAVSLPASGKKLKWGAYTGWSIPEMNDFSARIGREPDHFALFVDWGSAAAFPLYAAPQIRDKGKTMIIFWEAFDYNNISVNQPRFSYDAVLRGDWDAYFRIFAADAKRYGGPVILIPYSEMNGNWNPWGGFVNGNTPAKAVLAYRHIHDFFGGVPNVKFGWAPNTNSIPNTPENQIEKYYPGDAYVDYVGVDGFNFGYEWRTFDGTFGATLPRLAVYNKPLYIFSFASAEGAAKAAWITDALTVQMKKYPLLEGFVWFNAAKERNWLIWSDAASLAAFRAGLPI